MQVFLRRGMPTAAILVAGALLAGCAGMQLQDAKKVTPSGSTFAQALYKEYMALAQMEFDEGDYGDSDLFATRAMAAAAGKPTTPEELSVRNLPAAHKGALAEARRELMEALTAGAADKVAIAAAKAQAGFECWMQEQEENFQPADIAACKKAYMDAMKEVKAAMAPPPKAAAPAPAPKAPEKMAQTFTVLFDFNSAKLNKKAGDVVAAATKEAGSMKPGTVIVSGYTDRAGNDAYNMKLAEKRAKTVAGALEKSVPGVKGKVQVKAYGETENAVPTADGVKKDENRRVKIELIK